MTPLLASTFHVDADGYLTCPIQESIKEVMPLQTFTVPGGWSHSRATAVQGAVPGQRPTQIGISPSSHLQLRYS